MAPRPKMDEAEKRAEVLQTRVTPAELSDIKLTAAADHRNVSDWIRHVAMEAVAEAKRRASRRGAKPPGK
jgi:hypothetical protein